MAHLEKDAGPNTSQESKPKKVAYFFKYPLSRRAKLIIAFAAGLVVLTAGAWAFIEIKQRQAEKVEEHLSAVEPIYEEFNTVFKDAANSIAAHQAGEEIDREKLKNYIEQLKSSRTQLETIAQANVVPFHDAVLLELIDKQTRTLELYNEFLEKDDYLKLNEWYQSYIEVLELESNYSDNANQLAKLRELQQDFQASNERNQASSDFLSIYDEITQQLNEATKTNKFDTNEMEQRVARLKQLQQTWINFPTHADQEQKDGLNNIMLSFVTASEHLLDYARTKSAASLEKWRSAHINALTLMQDSEHATASSQEIQKTIDKLQTVNLSSSSPTENRPVREALPAELEKVLSEFFLSISNFASMHEDFQKSGTYNLTAARAEMIRAQSIQQEFQQLVSKQADPAKYQPWVEYQKGEIQAWQIYIEYQTSGDRSKLAEHEKLRASIVQAIRSHIEQ